MVNNVCYINIIIIILHNNLIECKRLSNCGHFIYGTCSIFDKWHNWKEIWRFSLKAILTCQLGGLANCSADLWAAAGWLVQPAQQQTETLA